MRISLLRKGYGAPANTSNFAGDFNAAGEKINAWAEKQTHGKIKNLIKPGVLNSRTLMVLANAVYLRAMWESRFKKLDSESWPFRGETGAVMMMHQFASFPLYEDDRLQALEMRYEGGQLSMVVLLPRKSDGLSELEASLSLEGLEDIIRKLAAVKIAVYLPKFKRDTESGLILFMGRLVRPLAAQP